MKRVNIMLSKPFGESTADGFYYEVEEDTQRKLSQAHLPRLRRLKKKIA